MLEGEAERKALQATKAESPDVEQPAEEEPSKDVPPAAVDPPADDDVAEEYDGYPTVGHAGQGSGLKTNMLLTADTLPPDVYGQPRRFVPTVPALRPDHVVSTVPNVAYAVVEGPARRRLHGMSANSLDLMPAPGSSAPQQFLVHPGMLDFGAVPEGGTYKMTISLTNISVEVRLLFTHCCILGTDHFLAQMARFRVRQPSNALVRTSYQPGAVMAGLTTKIEVELMASVPCVIGATAPHRDAGLTFAH